MRDSRRCYAAARFNLRRLCPGVAPTICATPVSLILLLALGVGGAIVYGDLVSAQTAYANRTAKDGFLDPFTLTTTTLDTVVLAPPDDPPILTLRPWIRVPYRPPIRSPYQPLP